MNLFYKIFRLKKSGKQNSSAEDVPNPLVAFHLSEATAYFQKGDYSMALSQCEQALSLDPKNATAYRLRGVIKYDLNDSLGAETDLRHALSLG